MLFVKYFSLQFLKTQIPNGTNRYLNTNQKTILIHFFFSKIFCNINESVSLLQQFLQDFFLGVCLLYFFHVHLPGRVKNCPLRENRCQFIISKHFEIKKKNKKCYR